MTSEVCMMNRLAVVLAADSATTVSRWNGGQREERYFKGANKIFQLSELEPVGLMIFDSADLLRVPWEVTIKAFRRDLGQKSFNTVDEYAKEFFSYLNDNNALFPSEVQDEAVVSAVQATAFRWLSSAVKDVAPADQQVAVAAKITAERAVLDQLPFSECLPEAEANKVLNDLAGRLKVEVEEWVKLFELPKPNDIDAMITGAFLYVVKHPERSLSTTGLVFAGFGDHQIFPEMVEYQSCGIIGGKHIYSAKEKMVIDHSTPASISAFAQTSMIDTFSAGLSEDAYSSMMVSVDEELGHFVDAVVAASGGSVQGVDKASLVQAAAQKISDNVLGKARDDHSLPLRSVIGFLPVDEMAGLAETLITLQSLKEKVTKPSETVGGPVDVAVITKHEGLVWIKRKHFFDPDLNSRYKLRQAAQHG